ncbi:Odorant receptor Or2 [Papilio machaon]|uniref:Odorant receptor Or2 n=1 Tax=Papilio machaon TaxID=76193 RepID=A0A0N1IPC6_PAPMA|nr:Odorant receptor Or2 [Papilio machaon]
MYLESYVWAIATASVLNLNTLALTDPGNTNPINPEDYAETAAMLFNQFDKRALTTNFNYSLSIQSAMTEFGMCHVINSNVAVFDDPLPNEPMISTFPSYTVDSDGFMTYGFQIWSTKISNELRSASIQVRQCRLYNTLRCFCNLKLIYYKPATCIIDGVMDTILAAFVASAIGQIEILSFNLRNFKTIAKRREKRQLKRFVSRNDQLPDDHIENYLDHCMQIMWMAVYLTCMLTEVFILCWFGNELILKSLELQNATFDGPWLDIDQATKIYIIIFMERCKRPLLITAGKYFTLSLSTYTNLINWSYKAFAVMRNMKNNVPDK